jgi:hypothetical protein
MNPSTMLPSKIPLPAWFARPHLLPQLLSLRLLVKTHSVNRVQKIRIADGETKTLQRFLLAPMPQNHVRYRWLRSIVHRDGYSSSAGSRALSVWDRSSRPSQPFAMPGSKTPRDEARPHHSRKWLTI